MVEELSKISNNHTKELAETYARKLGFSEDALEILWATVDTLEEILVRNKVFEQSREWDHIGVKLQDGKVVFPDGFEKVTNEILKDNQLYQLFLPEEDGGLGFTQLMQGILTETLAYHDTSLQILIMIGLSVLEPLILYRKPYFEDVIKDYADGKRVSGYVGFTEPQAGSNLENVRSTSEKVGDEYVLNGTKIFISNGGYAETGLFLARNMVDGKAQGTNVFLVDSLDNIEVLRLEEKSGLHTSPTAQLRFENVTVPEEAVISEVGNGYRKVLERLMGMRVGVSFQSIAAAKRGYQLAKDYSETREQFGRKIGEFPLIQRKLEAMEKTIPRMEEYGLRAGYALDRYIKGWVPAEVGANGKPSAELTAAKLVPGAARGGLVHYFASSAKLYTSEIVNQILYDASQIFGGLGFVAESDVNRITRDARVNSIYEGTSEIHSWLIGKTQKALSMMPNFKRPYQQYKEPTYYENILFERFPEIREWI